MKQVLFVQGGSAGAYAADAKLAESLRTALGDSYRVRYPQMPDEDEPDYDAWKQVILGEIAAMGDQPVLVGHSIGASVLAKVMVEGRPTGIAGVFLASAPFWYDDDFWKWDEARLPVDAGTRFPHATPLHLYHGEADDSVPFAHLQMYADAFPQAVVHALPGRGHQLDDDMADIGSDILRLPDR